MAYCSIQSPQLLHFSGNGGLSYGADQAWYPNAWQRQAGCGPTTCSHLMWYLAQTRTCCQSLLPAGTSGREAMLGLMEAVWQYVTPSTMGVHTARQLAQGAVAYGASRGVALSTRQLVIPKLPRARPSFSELTAFVSDAFRSDLPVAFLNLSNGTLGNLEAWHWVTLVALESAGVRMYDQGASVCVDLALWLKTTVMGGALVVVDIIHRTS